MNALGCCLIPILYYDYDYDFVVTVPVVVESFHKFNFIPKGKGKFGEISLSVVQDFCCTYLFFWLLGFLDVLSFILQPFPHTHAS